MPATLTAGVKSLLLTLSTPYDTIRTDDVRDDLVAVKVWYSTTSGFTPPTQGTLAFDGLGLSITIPDLVVGTTYYVKYAFISAIDPNTYTVSSELSAVPVEGPAGNSVTMIFKRSFTQPATPAASTGTPATWYADINSVPAGTDPLWASVGSKLGSSTNTTWQTPFRLEGASGTPGDSSRIAYRTQSQSAATPTISPNPTTGSTSFPTGWAGTITAPTAGQSLWAINGSYNSTTNNTTWGSPYLTQGFPTTIQSDNYNANTAGWQIQRDTGNAFFNNVTARGSIVTGTTGAQRIELNRDNSNRLNAFTSTNIRFLTIGGSGGVTPDSSVIGVSANSNIYNPVWIESSSPVGSGILSNTISTANAISAISSGSGRLFYGSVISGSNPDAVIRVDVDSPGHTNNGVQINMGNSTGAAFVAGGSGNGYAFDAVSATSGAAGSKSGIGFFRGIDFPTTTSVIVTSGTQAQIIVNFTNLTTAGPLLCNVTLEGTAYSFTVQYNVDTFNTLSLFVAALSAGINNQWQVSSTGTLTSGSFVFKRPVVGVVGGTNSAILGSFTGTFTNGTDNVYSSVPTVVRLNPFPNDSTRVLRGDGTWGTLAASDSGSINRKYNVINYGAIGNNIADDTIAIQSAINAASATGGIVYFPRGVYRITSALTYGAGAGGDPSPRVHFQGEGIAASVIVQTANANGLILSGYLGTPLNPNLYTTLRDLTFVGPGTQGQGLSIGAAAYVHVQNCQFINWDYGIYGSNLLSSTFVSCYIRFNQRGFLFERIATSAYTSSPNAISFVNCIIGANSIYGGWVLGPGVFNMHGGTVEGNGPAGANGANTSWGLRINEPSGATAIESAVGVNLSGTYFEVNRGLADLWIISQQSKAGVANNISGCSFVRATADFVTNNILFDATAGNGFAANISGCGFKGVGYTPSSSRMTIVNNNCSLSVVGCSFDSPTDAYVINNRNVFESGLRTNVLEDLSGNSFASNTTPLASGTASAGTAAQFSRRDHVHPFSVSTASPSGSGSLSYSNGVLTYTPPASTGTVTSVGTSGSGLGFSLSGGTITTSGTVSLTVPAAPTLRSNLGLGSLAQVSSLTTFSEFNSTAWASTPSDFTTRVYIPAVNVGSRGWSTITLLKSTILQDTGDTTVYWTTSNTTLNVTGNIVATQNITAFSDARLKTDVNVIADPFISLNDISGVRYTRKDTDKKDIGFIAQQVQKHYPELVFDCNDALSLNYSGLIAVLWEQNRELYKRLTTLEAKYATTKY